jgi:hypothetical protein
MKYRGRKIGAREKRRRRRPKNIYTEGDLFGQQHNSKIPWKYYYKRVTDT